jgi:radical SAM-linked protein
MRIRITFSKTGALRYTGHLDLHKLWERAARRAGLPLAYSQGFHPQPKIQIAAALPLGFSSRCELVDMWIGGESEALAEHPAGARLQTDLQAALPAGIQVLKVEEVEERSPALQTMVEAADYEIVLQEPADGSALHDRLASLMKAESLPRERRGKAYDLRPLIEVISLIQSPDGTIRLRMTLTAREGATGRPEEVLDALGISAETTRIERTRLLFKA